MDLLTVRDLTFTYPNSAAPALRNLSFSVSTGDFFVLLGRSGSGKSTLLRQLKPQLTPHGTTAGDVLFCGTPLSALPQRDTAAQIGFVQQNPQDQIVTDTVWHELAFGAESLGMAPDLIRRRVAETAAFFGLEKLFHEKTHTLSGGMLQLLNLAAAMVLQPTILILDEPTAQLDPIAAQTFLSMLQKVHRELGVTVLLTEHRTETVFAAATKAAVLEDSALLCCGSVQAVCEHLKENRSPLCAALPAPMRVWSSVDSALPCPVSVEAGQAFLKTYLQSHTPQPVKPMPTATGGAAVMEARDLFFAYEETPVLKNCSFTAHSGRLTCILGGNGAGKSTLLSLLNGRLSADSGTVHCTGKTALLPQQPQTLFTKPTLWEDLLCACDGIPQKEAAARVGAMIAQCGLQGLEQRHPFDLSGGELQRAALAKVLLTQPDILLLDEPTKGFDAAFKTQFAALLKTLQTQGIGILMVSHDIEFCAQYADWCALLFDGAIVSEGTPQTFFRENRFYTTQAARMAQGCLPDVVTTAQLIAALGGTPEPQNTVVSSAVPQNEQVSPAKMPLARWRKWCAGLSALAALVCSVLFMRSTDFSAFSDIAVQTTLKLPQLLLGGGFFLSVLLLAVFTAQKQPVPLPQTRQKLPARTWVSAGCAIALIPAVLWLSVAVLDTKQYYITALLVLVLSMLPFFLVFEGRKPQARELTLLATLCALAVAGRAAFFMLPQCKPVLAITILAGVALGGESGFLVGAVTMLLSNLLFAQGAWTPWQMFAMGIIGCLAGILSRVGILRRSRLSLCAFGAVSAIVIYGGIMNPASALLWGGEALNGRILLTYYAAGFPMDCIHAAATALFLWFLAPTMLQTLDRVREKYGIFT